jgi:hypothetical protein
LLQTSIIFAFAICVLITAGFVQISSKQSRASSSAGLPQASWQLIPMTTPHKAAERRV